MITGKNIIGSRKSGKSNQTFSSVNAVSSETLETNYSIATDEEIDEAIELAHTAFNLYRNFSGYHKAAFLDRIAVEIEALGESLIQQIMIETALPEARLTGERARTTGQLKLFASLLREGSWKAVRIDTAMPNREPLPRASLRQLQIPLGPVAVFAASNFPLAFSVAGGDTASALAAGCPVVFKAHSSHPGVSEMVAGAIIKAASATGMPDGIFSLLQGNEHRVGQNLVAHPKIKAGGFTGSFHGGMALLKTAQNRVEPIPVYTEMSSINPVVVLPEALRINPKEIAEGYVSSVLLGVGQFCTNPGILLTSESPDTEIFLQHVKEAMAKQSGGNMLSQHIYSSYKNGVQKLKNSSLSIVHEGSSPTQENVAAPVIWECSGADFLNQPGWQEEVFGPSSIIVKTSSVEEIYTILQSLQGQLTLTIHAEEKDHEQVNQLITIGTKLAGRVVWNAFPTGVEVSHAMVHGGPFPATSDSRSTSVGTAAIFRFTRPVCYQNIPDAFLPEELQNDNPLTIWRWVDGDWTKNLIN